MEVLASGLTGGAFSIDEQPGLPPGAITTATLRRHYLRLVAAYHPDRVAGLGAKLQRLAEEETKAINEAYAFFKRRLGEGP